MNATYFFDQDQDCHWYMIPSSLRAEWQTMTANDTDDQDELDKFDVLFAHHRTGGGISNIDFTPTNPQP